ncbi:MAG: hypothetical protein COY81_05240 [Candidatus Pacebacteria bacterium CG_4_10_14_0_8_um_filter_43_12]|nr:MAG: hypothetical protein COY81_05240 [Candidatus Pacebacteria bacterium CG_4_10_14_0_8_um_filter_43_12]
MKRIIYLLSFLLFVTISASTSKINAQVCVGTHTYVDYGCDYNSVTHQYTCVTQGAMNQSCGAGSCQTFGPVFCQGGTSCTISSYGTSCPIYYPPSPPPIATPPPSGTPQPSPTTEPEPGYMCVPGAGCQPTYNSYQSSAACAAGCTVDVTDPNAGLSSCPLLEETASDAIIYPGQTQSWVTWAPPSDATAAQRLLSTSPGLITKNYTSPGDMLTISYVFQEPETQAFAYYVFDDDSKTWFFYQGPDKPAVIMTRNDGVLLAARKIGYTQITDFSLGNRANAASVLKRVYRLDPDGDGKAWTVNSTATWDPVVNHIPKGFSLIPYVNCASALMADDHRYFGTNESKNIEWVCSQRKLVALRDDHDDLVTQSTGNYFSLEKDFPVPQDGHWPRTDTTWEWRDYDEFTFAFLMKKGFTDYRQGSLRPGFLRMPVLQIPVKSLYLEKVHEFYAYIQTGNTYDFKPVEDESDDSDSCLANRDKKAKTYDPTPLLTDEQQPKCENFTITDQSGNRTIDLKIGQTYTVSTKALLGSKIYAFGNHDFDSDTPSEGSSITNWDSSGLSTFAYATCDSGGLSCTSPVFDKVLKIAGSGSATTREIESNDDLSNNMVRVDFDARSDVGSTLGTVEITRNAYISIDNNLLPQPEGNETRTVQFVTPNYGTNPPVTTSWRHFSGFVKIPPAEKNNESRFIIRIRPVSGGSNTYYDNFVFRGWQDPAKVKFGMASATTYDGTPNNDPMDKCDTSVRGLKYNNDTYNASTGLYADAITIPEYRPGTVNPATGIGKPLQPGNYNVLTTFEYGSGLNLSGNPGTVGEGGCPGVALPTWDNSIASDLLAESERCYKLVTISTCNDTVPQKPVFTSAPYTSNPYWTYRDGTASPQAQAAEYLNTNATITLAPIESGGEHAGKAKISVQSAVQAASDPTTKMTFTITPHGKTTPVQVLQILTTAARLDTNSYNVYDFEITPDVAYSNDLDVVARAVNTESCNVATPKYSTTLTARVILTGNPTGQIFEVDRTKVSDLSTITCKETINVGGPSDPNIANRKLKTLNISELPNAVKQANLISAFKNPLQGIPYEYDTVTYSTSFKLPYFPGPGGQEAAWGGQTASLQLDFDSSGENGYHCVSCNAASDTSCIYPATDRAYELDAANKYFTATDTFQNMNFYLVKASTYDSWWQTRGGLVFAEASGTSIQSKLPLYQDGGNWVKSALCLPDTCQPFIAAKKIGITPASTDADASAGLPITNGTISDTNGSLGYLSQNNIGNIKVTGASTTYALPTYTEFRDLIDWGSSKIMDLNPSTAYSQFATPDVSKIYDTEADGSNVYVYKYDTGATINVATHQIDVKPNSKIIIFINGNLTIQGDSDVRQIGVDASNHEYLIFIVNGDIIFDSDLGYDPATQLTVTDPLVEGVYFANTNLIIKSKIPGSGTPEDFKFVGAGSFIGRVGVQLNRKFDAYDDILSKENNAKSPVEQFNFRPDFVVNAPDMLRQPELKWAEIN